MGTVRVKGLFLAMQPWLDKSIFRCGSTKSTSSIQTIFIEILPSKQGADAMLCFRIQHSSSLEKV